MLRPGIYLTDAGLEAQLEQITTARKLIKGGYDCLANEVQWGVLSLLNNEYSEGDFYELEKKSWGHIVALGKINHIWKSPIWDWKTGKLLSANSPGNWSLHDNFNIPPDSKPLR